MISPTRWVAIALVLALSLVPLASGAVNHLQAPKQEPSVRLRTDEVVVDAVVMDKKNRPVMNLTADDFDLFEDGVKQRIVSRPDGPDADRAPS